MVLFLIKRLLHMIPVLVGVSMLTFFLMSLTPGGYLSHLQSNPQISPETVERLKAIGRAYVRVGVRHPAHCEVIFRDDVINAHDEQLQAAGLRAYGLLESTVAEIAARHNPSIDVTDTARLCWAMVQGLVQLQSKFTLLDTTLGMSPAHIEDRAERFTELILTGVLAAR